MCIKTPWVSFPVILVLLRILGRIQYEVGECHKVYVGTVLRRLCFAVQAGFYSDVVECKTLDRRVPGRDMEIFKSSLKMVHNVNNPDVH